MGKNEEFTDNSYITNIPLLFYENTHCTRHEDSPCVSNKSLFGRLDSRIILQISQIVTNDLAFMFIGW